MNTLKNYDAGFCGSLPLNFINLIQPHGILMILSLDELKIIQVSENVKEILGISHDDILYRSIQELVDQDDFEDLKDKIEKWSVKDKIPLSLKFNNNEGKVKFSAAITPGDSFVMLEIEKAPEQEDDSFLKIYQEIKYIVASLKDGVDVAEVADIASIEIKKLSGFDRVMIYKFDEDWNGSVIAEAKETEMDSYMNLRFPASDIPKQARDLYHKNPYRLIPDIDFTPVRILPILNPLTRSFTDLSECTLRSVPPVHIEYLKNMDVKASMSTGLIINNKLWGLISRHHREPKHLG